MPKPKRKKDIKLDWEATAEYYYEKWKNKEDAINIIALIVLIITLISFDMQVFQMLG